MTVTLSKVVIPSAKRPDEYRAMKLRFNKELASDETMHNPGVTHASLAISNVALTDSSTAIACIVGGGAAGSDYDLVFQASTSAGQLIKRTAVLSVQNES